MAASDRRISPLDHPHMWPILTTTYSGHRPGSCDLLRGRHLPGQTCGDTCHEAESSIGHGPLRPPPRRVLVERGGVTAVRRCLRRSDRRPTMPAPDCGRSERSSEGRNKLMFTNTVTASHAYPPSQAAFTVVTLPTNTAVGGMPTRPSSATSRATASHGHPAATPCHWARSRRASSAAVTASAAMSVTVAEVYREVAGASRDDRYEQEADLADGEPAEQPPPIGPVGGEFARRHARYARRSHHGWPRCRRQHHARRTGRPPQARRSWHGRQERHREGGGAFGRIRDSEVRPYPAGPKDLVHGCGCLVG